MGQTHDSRRQFASDNYSGMCPEVAEALQHANSGHSASYGSDPWTTEANALFQEVFETDCEVFFVFNGTAANSLALASMCDSFHSVICHATAHVQTDECAAPGFFRHGLTLIPLAGEQGKLLPAAVKSAAENRRDVHAAQARAISLTQSTELGTVYLPEEIAALSKMARALGLHLHMDGARFANAVASLNVAPKQITWEAGVDVLCFGGTKNGMEFAEAVVFFNRDLARDFQYRRKQAGQLASKMRFLSAQWIGALKTGAWLRNARNANLRAQELETSLLAIPNLRIAYPRQANAVFVHLAQETFDALQERGWYFYNDVGPDGAARLMCSWDTASSDVTRLTKDIRELSS